MAIIFGFVVVNADYTTYQGLHSAISIIFMTALYQGYATYVACLPSSLGERVVYCRECDAQTYNTLWYFFGITRSPTSLAVISSSPLSSPLSSASGPPARLFYRLNISLSVLIQTLLGQLLAYLLSSGEVVAVVGVLISIMFLLFAKFNPPAAAIPDRYLYIFDVTPQRCSLSILVSLVFGNCPEDPVYDERLRDYTNERSELAC
uniref:ABC-2 type transporter transmembrane domain-containing protein n=1 Tax=Peronospora matthiolae TaxID=2874970 RepID=A0AAV1US56_9STRA